MQRFPEFPKEIPAPMWPEYATQEWDDPQCEHPRGFWAHTTDTNGPLRVAIPFQLADVDRSVVMTEVDLLVKDAVADLQHSEGR